MFIMRKSIVASPADSLSPMTKLGTTPNEEKDDDDDDDDEEEAGDEPFCLSACACAGVGDLILFRSFVIRDMDAALRLERCD